MHLFKRSVPVIAALGLVATGVLTAPGQAAAVDPARAGSATATTLTCEVALIGVLPSGRIIDRYVRNARIIDERKSAPLSYTPESMYALGGTNTETGSVLHSIVHSAGQPAKLVDLTFTDGSSVIATKILARFRPTPKARTWTSSGRFYSYAITPDGSLTRFSRFRDPGGQFWMANPRTVKTGMSGIRTLSYLTTLQTSSGVRKDVLYATTRGGALLQFQVPWSTPRQPRVTTLRTTGFADVTALSLSSCNKAGTIANIVAIEKGNNRARWWTFSSQFSPRPANLTRRQLIAPGAEWRLKATY